MTRALLRIPAAAFCWATALYAFLCSSPFAYQQFIRPRVFHWVGAFADNHSRLYFVWLLLVVVSLARDFHDDRWTRRLSAAFAIVWGTAGVWLTAHPLMPSLADDSSSLWIGAAAIVPLVWLAAIDVVASRRYLHAVGRRPAEAGTGGRLLTAAIGTSIVVPVVYAVVTLVALGTAFEPDLLAAGLGLGLLWNVVHYLVLSCAAFLMAALVDDAFSPTAFGWRYAAAALTTMAFLSAVAARLVADAIGVSGNAGIWVVSLSLGLGVAAPWLGLRLRRLARSGASLSSGFDAVFGPAPGNIASEGAVASGIALFAFIVTAAAARLDWDFTLAKLAAAAVSIAVFERVYRVSPRRPMPVAATAVVCLVPLALHAADNRLQKAFETALARPGFSVRHTLDRYVVYNPSFRLTDGLLRTAPDAPRFDRFLRANTGLPATATHPVDVDFVTGLGRGPATPSIFLFVVDSLRPDYLGAYNPRVSFTPQIDRFAGESVTFRRAFTRYGGTGLSMPAIWMGAAGVHTQYVRPFRPMNALEKLLDANGYQRFVSMDHIMTELLTPSALLHELDRGVPEMSIDFCTTLAETEERVATADRPVFVHSRSLNLHVAAIRASADPPGQKFPGFEARYASRVHRMDACFGGFIDFLKRRGMYNDSVVILTADHGEELGADGRWGHAYYLFPGVLEVPLLVHLPRSLAASSFDADAAAFTTDITPTLYAALGYRPERATPLMGEPLVGDAVPARRRRSTEVVIASYGAVYGTLMRNGSRLYIVDANHETEYAYERFRQGWREMPVTAAIRAIGQRSIREYVEEIAREYGVSGAG